MDLRDDELPGTCGKWVLEKTARGEVPLGWDLNADVMRLRAWSPEHKAWLELSIQVADEPMSLLHPEDFGFLPEYTCENDDGVLMNIFCPWGVSGGEYLAPIRDSRVMNKEQLREMREKLARESAIAALDYVKATLLDDSCRSAVGMRIDRLKGFLDNTSDAEEIMERLNAPP